MDPELEADKILAKAMMHLMTTAANDGIITKEEAELVDKVEFSLRFYKKLLVDALADGVIDEREQQTLITMKDKIIEEGYNVAETFDGVSKDEMNILISIMLSLKVPTKNRSINSIDRTSID